MWLRYYYLVLIDTGEVTICGNHYVFLAYQLRRFLAIADIYYMSRQELYKEKYRQIKLGWHDSATLYAGLIDSLVDENTKILDVGCGHVDFMKPVYGKTQHTYGLDPNLRTLERNEIINHKKHGSVEKIPFPDDFFDLVVSAWVLEHLKFPLVAFQEIYRTLKPGGKVIFLTPNTWNYNVWLIRLIPELFHDFLTRRLYQRQDHDTFDTFYRINSPRKIDKILLPLGYKKVKLILNGDPSYISFNDFLFKIACLIEKVIDNRLSFLKVHLIGIYEK